MGQPTEPLGEHERLVEELTWLAYSLGWTGAEDLPHLVAFRNAHAPEAAKVDPAGPEAAEALEALRALRHANYRRRLRMCHEAGIDRGAALPVNLADDQAAARRLAQAADDVEAEVGRIEGNLEGDLFPFQEEAHKQDLRLAARHRLAIHAPLERLGGATFPAFARFEALARQEVPARRY